MSGPGCRRPGINPRVLGLRSASNSMFSPLLFPGLFFCVQETLKTQRTPQPTVPLGAGNIGSSQSLLFGIWGESTVLAIHALFPLVAFRDICGLVFHTWQLIDI